MRVLGSMRELSSASADAASAADRVAATASNRGFQGYLASGGVMRMSTLRTIENVEGYTGALGYRYTTAMTVAERQSPDMLMGAGNRLYWGARSPIRRQLILCPTDIERSLVGCRRRA